MNLNQTMKIQIVKFQIQIAIKIKVIYRHEILVHHQHHSL